MKTEIKTKLKRLTALLLSAAIAVSFAACSSDGDGEDGETDRQTEVETHILVNSRAPEETVSEESDESEDPPAFPDPENPADSGYAGEIFAQIENSDVEMPMMIDVDDDRLDQYEVYPDDAESYAVKEAAISAVFVQIIIIEAKEDKISDVNDAMLKHQATLQDSAFYPQGAAAAAASIVGTKGNIVYLLCHEDAQEIEKILLNFIG